ncbi:indolepyruvate ferredoxin oxidoreductase [Clostridiales bacterium PH28_bin88]|nr:indolepyruvate ferredoxin oxidoreductase [Clostridiales bacterium PH28_bin88]
MKAILSGNEALARGAWEAGVTVAAAYPGTPSTEIIENMARYPEVYSEWAPNEKVALEVGLGAAIGGARVLVAMKHVGVNVAADPLFTLSYTGVNGGLVLVSADDPGMHSSQNEQDNRYYAKFAKLPVLEPSDSQEARDFMIQAFKISETFDTPVMLRMTTRVAHGQSVVTLGERAEVPLKEYVKNAAKFVMLPGHARGRHPVVEQRLIDLAAFAETLPLNTILWGKDRKVGIITSGACYQYVREAAPEASVLKLGMTFPLPEQLITGFARQVEEVIIVEELEPFLEEQLLAWGIPVKGKEIFPRLGEFSPELVAEKLGAAPAGEEIAATATVTGEVPARPPMLCPGCPHRGVFYVLKKKNLVVTGDIGCYTLGALPPLSAMDTCICMGAGIGAALGMEKARGREFAQKMVAVIGDSTFMHSGITGLMDVVYNQGATTVLILDNGITAMTGHQQHPGTGKTVKQEPTHQVDLEALVRALGVKRVQVVDAYDMAAVEAAITGELAADEPSVVITRRPCVLLLKENDPPYTVMAEQCNQCGRCRRIGCPALVYRKGEAPVVDITLCTGCGLCAQMCRQSAIVKAGE